MSRIVNASVTTALKAPHLAWAVFVDLDFASGHFRAFNGIGEYIYQGETFTGVAKFGSLGKIAERIDARDYSPLTLELSGVPADLLVEHVPDRPEWFRRPGTVYFVVFDTESYQPLANEPAIYEGFMDQLSFKREGNIAAIGVTIKHHSTLWANVSGHLYTHEHQRLVDSTDVFFNHVHEQKKALVWGGQSVSTGAGGGVGGSGPSDPTPRRPF